ncbi:hypothetical protein N9C86_01520 [Schleiferiaceae bacterium]|nr:hypothetical protein [Schleiferiaceae bacterium]
MFRDRNWNKLGDIGKKWKLIDFDESQPPSWEKYWKDQREYWGADRKDKKRVEHYFGKYNTEDNLLKDSRKKYEQFVDYLKEWNGLCKKNEIVQVIKLEKNVIALSKQWTGKVKDHKDLEIWLKQKFKLGIIPKDFFCEIYSFGTIAKTTEFSNEYGRVSHQLGKSQDKNELIEIIDRNHIKIGDAKFEIL